MIELLVYFDSKCSIPAVKLESINKVNYELGRRVNVIRHYKLINGACVEFVGNDILLRVKND